LTCNRYCDKIYRERQNRKGVSELKVIVVKADTDRDFEEYCGKYTEFISAERRERTERMRSQRDRITSVTAELTVRREITEALETENSDIVFGYGEHGKPFLKGREDFQFSFSHAGGYVVCAFSSRPVGIDVENSCRGNIKIAGRYFTENEYRKIYESGETDFVSVWTAKEAYVKYLGTGLSQGLDTFDVLDGSSGCLFSSFELPGGYCVSVCSETETADGYEMYDAEEIFAFYTEEINQ